MPQKTNNKIIYGVVILVAILTSIIVFVLINPTNNSKIGDIKDRFLPFGNPPSAGNNPFVPTPDDTETPDDAPFVIQKMRRLVDAPVAGASFFTDDMGQISIRYAEQKNGDVYDYSLSNGVSRQILRQNLPGVHNVLWNNNGKNAIFRFLKTVGNQDTIKTYALFFEEIAPGEDAIFEGRWLPDELPEVIVSPISEKVAYLQKNKKGDSFIWLEEIKEDQNMEGDQNREQIFASPFSEWLLEQPTEALLTLATKPSYNLDGYLYFVDIASKTTTKILGNKKGLMALTSPDATKILYAESAKNSYELILYNVETKKETALGIKAFPEKCVWSVGNSNLLYCAVSNLTNNKNMPDEWYQGGVSFSDDIWLINTETGKIGLLARTADFDFEGQGIDVIKPFLSPDNSQLVFTNKKDGTLWLLELETIENAGL
ncbi:MAG: hypothetical protein ABIJ80_01980 [Patescibacteria group bacterium]